VCLSFYKIVFIFFIQILIKYCCLLLLIYKNEYHKSLTFLVIVSIVFPILFYIIVSIVFPILFYIVIR